MLLIECETRMPVTTREDCCELASGNQACAMRRQENRECVSCGTRLRPVSPAHVMRQIRHPAGQDIRGDYGFCPASGCSTVFVASDGTFFTSTSLRHPPAYKSGNSGDLLCYCFDFRGVDLLSERADDALAYISARIRAGDCACDITNPSAGCCLGSIGAYRRAHQGEPTPAEPQ